MPAIIKRGKKWIVRGAAAGDTPMKQLQEIVAEILEERKTEFERIVGGPIGAVDAGNPDILRALLNDGFNRRQRVQQRIKEDPALAKLINAMLPAFVLIGASQIPADEKGRVCVQFLVELVEIWEEANNRFVCELGLPQKPAMPQT